MFHYMGPGLLEGRSEDEVRSWGWVHPRPPGRRLVLIYLDYYDLLRRGPGGWRFAHRHLLKRRRDVILSADQRDGQLPTGGRRWRTVGGWPQPSVRR